MPVKRNDKTVSRKCKPYQLDLTDYVRGDMTFLTKKKQQQLFEHLRQCASCRKDFFDWEELFGVMVTKHHLAKPAIKKKMNDMIKQFKSSASAAPTGRQAKKMSDVKVEINAAARRIQEILKGHGKTPIPDLRKETGLVDYPFYEAIGWLTMSEKVVLTKDQGNRPHYASLR